MRRRSASILWVLIVMTALVISACGAQPAGTQPAGGSQGAAPLAAPSQEAGSQPGGSAAPEAPKSIRIGYALPLSGPYAIGAGVTTLPNYKLWVEQVNAQGGIMLSKYGKRVPVEVIEYDDRSDPETQVRLTERLILQDKVDLLLAPYNTAFHMAVAPVYDKYGYPLLGVTAISGKVKQVATRWPYAFWLIPQPDDLAGHLVQVLKELKDQGKIGNKVAVLYITDEFGLDMAAGFAPLLPTNGFELVYFKSYPLGVSDLTPQLQEIMRLNPDVFVGFSYPDDNFMITQQAGVLGFNPPVFYTAIGTGFPVFKEIFGDKAEGVMGVGGWVDSPAAREYFSQHVSSQKQEPDRVGSPLVYASLEMLQQAIEQVGEIDRAKIRDAIDGSTFDTVLGRLEVKDQVGYSAFSQVGQWQGGEFVPIRSAADALFPKPKW